MASVQIYEEFTTEDGRRFKPVVMKEGSLLGGVSSPCDLCDLRNECDVGRCKSWRELAVLSLTCMVRTYFKEIR